MLANKMRQTRGETKPAQSRRQIVAGAKKQLPHCSDCAKSSEGGSKKKRENSGEAPTAGGAIRKFCAEWERLAALGYFGATAASNEKDYQMAGNRRRKSYWSPNRINLDETKSESSCVLLEIADFSVRLKSIRDLDGKKQ